MISASFLVEIGKFFINHSLIIPTIPLTRGLLTNHLLKYPFSVIYFKDLAKVNYQIQTFIKSILKTDHIFDSKNNKISLQNVIFVIDERENKEKIGLVN